MPSFPIRRAALFAAVALATQSHAQMGGGMDFSPSMPQQADPKIPFEKGVAAFNAGDYATAVRELAKARNARPEDPEINYALGLAYNGAGKKADAKRALQRAARGRDAPIGAFLQLGLVSIELGDRPTAAAQQAMLDKRLAACAQGCTDSDRAEIKAAQERLSAALGPQ